MGCAAKQDAGEPTEVVLDAYKRPMRDYSAKNVTSSTVLHMPSLLTTQFLSYAQSASSFFFFFFFLP